MSTPIITIHNLTKEFLLPHEKHDTLKEYVFNFFRPQTYERLKAVDNVSFEVKQGEFLGIIGRNGSGKSTLLKLIAGVLKPTSGHIKIRGKITPFLELGVGFQPELSGRDNVFLYGALLGLSRKQIKEKYDSIVAFAELERFMDQKVKNYSSGMQVRIAFSIAAHTDADILLIDEVLAVGDENYRRKCLRTMEQFKKQGKTCIIVSHDLNQVGDNCKQILWIDKGKIKNIDAGTKIINQYLENIRLSAQ